MSLSAWADGFACAITRAGRYAIEQPEDLDVSGLVVRPTASPFRHRLAVVAPVACEAVADPCCLNDGRLAPRGRPGALIHDPEEAACRTVTTLTTGRARALSSRPAPVATDTIRIHGARGVDTGAKLDGYFRLPGVVHYLIVLTARRGVIHHGRSPDSGIDTRILSSGTITLDPPGIAIDIDEIYGR
jgi:hypothetical protein